MPSNIHQIVPSSLVFFSVLFLLLLFSIVNFHLRVREKLLLKKQIQHIYDDSNQNYGAPKITKELRKTGECISQRTVGKYMREMGIKAQWIKPWTTTEYSGSAATEYSPLNHYSKFFPFTLSRTR